jgi:succinate dehydrogenase/fumarate reductase-like Fe-S protein
VPDGPPRLPDVDRGRGVSFTCDGEIIHAHTGETVAAALLAAGRRTLRASARRGEARGLFCAMGICFDCVMRIDGQPGLRACLTPIREGMVVTSL